MLRMTDAITCYSSCYSRDIYCIPWSVSSNPVMTLSSSSEQFSVRFSLPDGQVTVLQCDPRESVGSLKRRISRRRSATLAADAVPLALLDLRLPDSDVFCADHQNLSRLLELFPAFRESNRPNQIVDVVCAPAADRGDAQKRAQLRPSPGEPILAQGYLLKRGPGRNSKFKKRYFVLQNCTLFYFANQEALKNAPALAFIPLGRAEVKPSEEEGGLGFELRAEHVGRRNFVLKAEDEHAYQMWIQSFAAHNLRRAKSIIVCLAEELELRECLSSEGLFRKSANMQQLSNLKTMFDRGDAVDLRSFPDEHVLAGLIKLTLRDLPAPLLSFELYDAFVQIGHNERVSDDERALMLRRNISQLPPGHQGLLQYLVRFLHQVAQQSHINLMNASNLAIVMGPNILRPASEGVEKSFMLVSKPSYGVIEKMIALYPLIWESAGVWTPSSWLRVSLCGPSPTVGFSRRSSDATPCNTRSRPLSTAPTFDSSPLQTLMDLIEKDHDRMEKVKKALNKLDPSAMRDAGNVIATFLERETELRRELLANTNELLTQLDQVTTRQGTPGVEQRNDYDIIGKVVALFPFQGVADMPSEQLRFDEGVTIQLLPGENGGWWRGRLEDRVGWFPASYVKKIETDNAFDRETEDDDEEFSDFARSRSVTDEVPPPPPDDFLLSRGE